MNVNLTFVEKENNLVETLQKVLVVITEILKRKSHKNTVNAGLKVIFFFRFVSHWAANVQIIILQGHLISSDVSFEQKYKRYSSTLNIQLCVQFKSLEDLCSRF